MHAGYNKNVGFDKRWMRKHVGCEYNVVDTNNVGYENMSWIRKMLDAKGLGLDTQTCQYEKNVGCEQNLGCEQMWIGTNVGNE